MSDTQNEIRDPEGLLKAYEKAKADLVALRQERDQLMTIAESVDLDAVRKWRDRTVKAELKATLQAQGIENPERLIRFINLEAIEVDEESDTLVGLDEALADVKANLPEIFDERRRAGRSSADIHEKTEAKPALTTTELQAQSLGF